VLVLTTIVSHAWLEGTRQALARSRVLRVLQENSVNSMVLLPASRVHLFSFNRHQEKVNAWQLKKVKLLRLVVLHP